MTSQCSSSRTSERRRGHKSMDAPPGGLGERDRLGAALETLRRYESELDAKRGEIDELSRELDATNQGLIALHRELEDAREAESVIAAIVHAADDAMYSMTMDEVVTSWNPGAERLLGYGDNEIVGRSVRLLVSEGSTAEFDIALGRLRHGTQAERYDSWQRRKDGSHVEVTLTLSAIRDQADQPIGYAAVMRDLTDQRQAESAMATAHAVQEVFAERDRIARDLHDLVIQRLFASGMALQSLLNHVPEAGLGRRLVTVIDDLDDTIVEIRSTIFSLGHSRQDVAGLRSQLLEIVSKASEILRFQPRIHFEGAIDVAVDAPVAENLLAVLREALSNVARHARASAVEVVVSAGDDLLLTVADDGRGIGTVSRSSGLANLAERAESLGGSFNVKGGGAGGTLLEWRVPLSLQEVRSPPEQLG